MSDEQTQATDDPSGPGWRDVGDREPLQVGDMFWLADHWEATGNLGYLASALGTRYRRRIEPQQPSDSAPEIVEDLRKRLAECEVLLAEYDRGGQPVNAELQQLREQVRDLTQQVQCDAVELQQLREQVATLTRERDRYQSSLRDHYRDGQQRAAEALQAWLRPVLELVAENPEDASPLAVAVLGYLPGIASRLIEE